MQPRVILVHDDHDFVGSAIVAFRRAGLSVTAFSSPIDAWDHLKTSERVNVLITRYSFGPGQLTGAALARLAHSGRPMVRALFMNRPSPTRAYVDDWDALDGMGEFLPESVGADDLPVAAVRSFQP